MKFLFKEKKILENFSYLSILQFGRYLIPLIIVPYLIRTIGLELYGLIIFAQSIISYFVLLVDYGFSLTGVREVSLNKNNINDLSSIVNSILLIKLILFLLSALILICLAPFFKVITDNYNLFIFTMWLCLYEFIFPKWYFQGIEKMKFITYLDLLIKILTLILVFVFISKPSDYILFPIFNAIGVIVTGCISFYIIYRVHKLKLVLPKLNTIIHLLRDSTPVFISKLSQFYIKLNKILIGNYIGYNELALYDVAEKVLNVTKMPITIFGQAIFPKISRVKNIQFLTKSFLMLTIINIFIVGFIFIFSDYIIFIFINDNVQLASLILILLSISLFPITINVFFSTQTLFGFGFKKEFMNTILSASLFYVITISLIYFTSSWSLLVIASVVVLSEYITSITAIYYNIKLKLLK